MFQLRFILVCFGCFAASLGTLFAGLDTETYVSVNGQGYGEINGDRTGLDLVTLEDVRGGDLWNGGDSFIYLHDDDQITTDFTAMVRVVSQTAAVNGRWGKAGIHARASLDPRSQNAMTQVATGNGSQADPPPDGSDHNPVPARIAGRTQDDGQENFELPIFRNPNSGLRAHSGNQVANDFFNHTTTLPSPATKVWLSLEYTAAENRFVSGIALDENGRPGPWSYSNAMTDVPADGDGWYVGLAYSVHTDFEIPPASLHGVTFDSYTISTPDGLGDADFNSDGRLDCVDIGALTSEIAAGGNRFIFDLNADSVVDEADLNFWLGEAGALSLPSGGTFLRGDANLDGFVDVSDFNIWNSSKFLLDSSWCSGDFNADGLVDVSDFNLWNSNKFRSSGEFAVVPEPSIPMFWLFCYFLLHKRRLPLWAE